MSTMVFWVVTTRGLVNRYQRFGAQIMEAVCSSETLTSIYKSTQPSSLWDET